MLTVSVGGLGKQDHFLLNEADQLKKMLIVQGLKSKVQCFAAGIDKMATIKTFEEIEAWKKSRVLADKIYRISSEGTFAKDYKLINQINGAAGSTMDNIAEGFERGGSKEFIQFLFISKGSAGEVRSQLYRALDRKHINQQTFDELRNEVIVIGKLISGLISYLKASSLKGNKFSEPMEDYS